MALIRCNGRHEKTIKCSSHFPRTLSTMTRPLSPSFKTSISPPGQDRVVQVRWSPIKFCLDESCEHQPEPDDNSTTRPKSWTTQTRGWRWNFIIDGTPMLNEFQWTSVKSYNVSAASLFGMPLVLLNRDNQCWLDLESLTSRLRHPFVL